jgi:hypothetical protein
MGSSYGLISCKTDRAFLEMYNFYNANDPVVVGGNGHRKNLTVRLPSLEKPVIGHPPSW